MLALHAEGLEFDFPECTFRGEAKSTKSRTVADNRDPSAGQAGTGKLLRLTGQPAQTFWEISKRTCFKN